MLRRNLALAPFEMVTVPAESLFPAHASLGTLSWEGPVATCDGAFLKGDEAETAFPTRQQIQIWKDSFKSNSKKFAAEGPLIAKSLLKAIHAKASVREAALELLA